MSERYTKERHQAFVEAQEAERRKAEAERAERLAKGAARTTYLADGGTEAAFEREWPEIRDAQRRKRAVDADREARQAQRAAGISRI